MKAFTFALHGSLLLQWCFVGIHAITLEAEDIDDRDIYQCTKENRHPNASPSTDGKSYMDMGGAGSWIQFRVSMDDIHADQAASNNENVQLEFRYANGDANARKCELRINDLFVTTISFHPTRSDIGWGRWWTATVTVNPDVFLGQEETIIRLTVPTGSAGPNIDYLRIGQDEEDERDDTANNGSSGSSSMSVLLEAEALDPATEMKGCFPANVHSGASRRGGGKNSYVDMGGLGSWIQWNQVKTSSPSPNHQLRFRYANGDSSTRKTDLYVNGELVQTISFQSTGNWKTWRVVSVTVPFLTGDNGGNVIRLTVSTDSGGPNIDFLRVVAVSGGTQPRPPVTTPTPSRPTPTCSSTLMPTERLTRGQRRCSPNGLHELVLTADDGRFLLRQRINGNQRTVWDAQISNATAVVLQRFGNLVVIGQQPRPALWASGTHDQSQPNSVTLYVLNDGSVELQRNGQAIWCVNEENIGCGGRVDDIGEVRPPAPAPTQRPPAPTQRPPTPTSRPPTPTQQPPTQQPTSELKIVVFAVDSADSSIIIFPTGKVMMIDSATPKRFKDRVLPFLQRHNIRHLDYYVETHTDFDHTGGRQIMRSNGMVDDRTEIWDWNTWDYEDTFRLEGTNWFIYNARDVKRYGGSYANPNSLSYRIEYNGFIYTGTGDEYPDSQERFLDEHPDLVQAHVRNTAHHMWGPVNKDFLLATNPFIFIISSSIRVKEEKAFSKDFLGVVKKLKQRGQRLKDYFLTAETGHVFVRAASGTDWSYDLCPNLNTCRFNLK